MGVRPGEGEGGRGGSQQNGDYVLVRKSFEVWKDQRGTLNISSEFVAGVSRRMAAGVPGVVCARKERKGESRKKNKRDEWSASGANKTEKEDVCSFSFNKKGGTWREREGFLSRSIQSRRDGGEKKGGREGQESTGRQGERREHSKYEM